jgi:hypothetical protein
MIKLRQTEELLVTLNLPGPQTADLNLASFLVPFACRLKAIYAKLTVAGVTLTSIYDVNKNGTTIYSGTKLTFATTVADPVSYAALTADPTEFVKGDVISVDLDTAHSGTPAEGLVILLVLQRGKASRAAETVGGGVGPENE